MADIKITALPDKGAEETNVVALEFPKDFRVLKTVQRKSLIDFYKHQLDSILQAFQVNDSKKYMMSFLHAYGETYKQKLLESKIFTSLDSINNYESVLRRENYIVGYWPNVTLNPQIVLSESSFIEINVIEKDLEASEIQHKNYKA
jgi:hypothetical protein